jgi:hypothetical protein
VLVEHKIVRPAPQELPCMAHLVNAGTPFLKQQLILVQLVIHLREHHAIVHILHPIVVLRVIPYQEQIVFVPLDRIILAPIVAP